MPKEDQEVKPVDDTTSPPSGGEQKTEPVSQETEADQSEAANVANAITELKRAQERELEKLREIRAQYTQERDRQQEVTLDPSSREAMEKLARQEAERVNRREQAAAMIRTKHGISLKDWEEKVLRRYTALSGEYTISGIADDYEAAVRAAMPEVITRSVEDKLRRDAAKDELHLRDANSGGSSTTTVRQAVTQVRLSADQQEAKRIAEVAERRTYTEEEWLELDQKTTANSRMQRSR